MKPKEFIGKVLQKSTNYVNILMYKLYFLFTSLLKVKINCPKLGKLLGCAEPII